MSNTTNMTNQMKEIMKLQPVINIGTIGHVANGKSTIVKSLTLKATQQFSKEKERNITIRLGYANAKIWKCNSCRAPKAYTSSDSCTMFKLCDHCNRELELVNHVSIVDCPGHKELTSTMLNGSCVMDYAVLVEASNNQTLPAPQTSEHLMATKSANIPTSMVIMNKIDLCSKQQTEDNVKKMITYLNSVFDEKDSKIPPIVPVSASFDVNVDVVCEYLSRLKVPNTRKQEEQFKMIIIRSFDINKPGIDVTKLNGGVIGGTILRGSLNVGDNINIYPGIYKKIHESKKQKEGPDYEYSPLMGKVISIKSEQNELKMAIPGGLLGIQLTIDPAFSRNDHLSGSIAVKTDSSNNKELKVYDKIIINMTTFSYDHDKTKTILKNTKELSINVNSNNVECKVMKYVSKSKELYLFLDRPIAIDNIDNLASIILKNSNKDILGRGKIIDGIECDLMI